MFVMTLTWIYCNYSCFPNLHNEALKIVKIDILGETKHADLLQIDHSSQFAVRATLTVVADYPGRYTGS